MRQLFFALALLVSACAAPPASADQIAADHQLLRSCVAQASGDRAALAQCAGVIARACIEAEGVNTMSEVLCWSAEADAWQSEINAATTRIAAADPVEGEMLANANTAWTAWLDSECAYRAYEIGDGSGQQVDHVRCAADLTTARAIDLLAR